MRHALLFMILLSACARGSDASSPAATSLPSPSPMPTQEVTNVICEFIFGCGIAQVETVEACGYTFHLGTLTAFLDDGTPVRNGTQILPNGCAIDMENSPALGQ